MSKIYVGECSVVRMFSKLLDTDETSFPIRLDCLL